ncbi:MAG TPA: efflux RND transporter periplasmic adaptor subunit [Byssovorax sp.]|jgi:HlyD family secretion protein
MTVATPLISLAPPRPQPGVTPAGRRLWRVARWAAPTAIALGAATTWYAVRLRAHPASPVHLEAAVVDRGAIAARVTATGATSALVTVQVGSQVSGRIATLGADFNTPVRRGQVIATIEPELFAAAAAQARANLAAARAGLDTAKAQESLADRNLARARGLFGEGLVSRADLDAAVASADVGRAQVAAAQATVRQAAAAREQAELNLRYTTVVSPIDGTVISRNVDVGQTVAAALQAPTLFTIAHDLREMQVDTNVAEADIGKVREGMSATFTVDAYPGKLFEGRVRQVRDAATTVQNVVTYDAVIDVDNTAGLLRPGMTASASFVYAERADALRIPNAALRFKPDPATVQGMRGRPGSTVAQAGGEGLHADERVVWVEAAGRAEPRVVVIGISDGRSTEVVSGPLAAAERVVTEASLASQAHQ